ncbi:MAG TPA: rhodanese-like domain-containing protein, partial [Actinomycetes bacterium]|nr:rhodanese-like domain-containing protein [Actinomycetes bacterium]
GADVDEVAEMQRELVRIGIDRPAAYAVGSPTDWASDGVPITSYPRRTHPDLARAMAGEPRPLVLDVRRNLEHADGYVLGAKHVPLHELVARQGEVATWAGTGRGPVWVYCGSGFRAAVAASLLERIGVDVVHVDDEFANAAPSGVPLARTEVGQTLGATYTD